MRMEGDNIGSKRFLAATLPGVNQHILDEAVSSEDSKGGGSGCSSLNLWTIMSTKFPPLEFIVIFFQGKRP